MEDGQSDWILQMENIIIVSIFFFRYYIYNYILAISKSGEFKIYHKKSGLKPFLLFSFFRREDKEITSFHTRKKQDSFLIHPKSDLNRSVYCT